MNYFPQLLKCQDLWNINIDIKGILLYYYCHYCYCILFTITSIQGVYNVYLGYAVLQVFCSYIVR